MGQGGRLIQTLGFWVQEQSNGQKGFSSRCTLFHEPEPRCAMKRNRTLNIIMLIGLFLEVICIYPFLFFKNCFYLFIFRERGRKGEREGQKHRLGASHTPQRETWPATRHVPWLGVDPVTLRFTGWHLIHWDTPARATFFVSGKLGEMERCYNCGCQANAALNEKSFW